MKINQGLIFDFNNITRQGYHQSLLRSKNTSNKFEQIRPLIMDYRATKNAYSGSETLFYNLDVKDKINVGVNKFAKMMVAADLVLKVVRTKIVTTRTSSRSSMYTNKLNGLKINGINQVVVGDLTYVYIDNRLYYLFTLFDLYSGNMVGAHGGSRMRGLEAVKALDQLIALRGKKVLTDCIHHTDGGSQYFSNIYLNTNKMMTKSVAKTCLENGYAEQRNGLIKAHFMPLINGRNEANFQKGIAHIKDLYNSTRQKHLGWLSPLEFEEKWAKVSADHRPQMELYDFTTN